MKVHPAFPTTVNHLGYASLGACQVPKFRPSSSDPAARTGVIFGAPQYVPIPLKSGPRAQTIKFAGQ